MTAVKVAILWAVIFGGISLWLVNSSTIYFFHVFSSIEVAYVIGGLSIALIIVAVLHSLKELGRRQKLRKTTYRFFFIIGCLCLCIPLVVAGWPFLKAPFYTEIKSPKGEVAFVVREQRERTKERGIVFEKTGYFTMKKRITYDASQRNIAFRDGKVDWKWEKNRLLMYEKGTQNKAKQALVVYF